MHRPNGKSWSIKTALDMTPLIDIVFQLLIFFVMTFRLVEQEADFHVKAPRSGVAINSTEPPLPTLVLAITADSNGNVSEVRLNGERLTGFPAVTDRLAKVLIQSNLSSAPISAEMEIACSPGLKHAEAVRALDAVTGIRNRDGAITPLIEMVRFAELR